MPRMCISTGFFEHCISFSIIEGVNLPYFPPRSMQNNCLSASRKRKTLFSTCIQISFLYLLWSLFKQIIHPFLINTSTRTPDFIVSIEIFYSSFRHAHIFIDKSFLCRSGRFPRNRYNLIAIFDAFFRSGCNCSPIASFAYIIRTRFKDNLVGSSRFSDRRSRVSSVIYSLSCFNSIIRIVSYFYASLYSPRNLADTRYTRHKIYDISG